MQDALENLMRGRTSIVLSHRLSTVATLDRIVVLEEGAIVEDGAHAELSRVCRTPCTRRAASRGRLARRWARSTEVLGAPEAGHEHHVILAGGDGLDALGEGDVAGGACLPNVADGLAGQSRPLLEVVRGRADVAHGGEVWVGKYANCE